VSSPTSEPGPAPSTVLLALGDDPREEPLLAAVERSGSRRLRVGRRCLDLADLLVAADAGVAKVAVVSSHLPRLDASSVARLAGTGVWVVAVVDRSDGAAVSRLRQLGVLSLLLVEPLPPGPAGPAVGEMFLEELSDAVARGPGGARAAELAGAPPVEQATESAPLGRLVAVWGPVGAPGRSTVARTLADELARLQVDTLLADADTYGPSLAQCWGILDEASGLAAATRAANAGTLDVGALARCARSLRPGLRVLTGLTRPDRWLELPPAALAAVWRTARALSVWTVVDCGFCLEQDEEIAYDTRAPLRNGATLATLTAADLVVAVGSADPVGLQRLIRTLPELRERAPQAELRVVVNQVRRGPVGRNPTRRVAETLDRYAGVTSALFVPDDRPALDAALAAGRTLAEVADSSPARVVLQALAVELAGSGADQ
jgi:MinD-like ATPase involved in chromosome partitioning or flagellar assembly